MNIMKSSAWLLVALSASSTVALAHGPGDAGQEEVTQLQNIRLPDAPGRNGVMATVSYKPGQVSIPHVHSGSVFAYVLVMRIFFKESKELDKKIDFTKMKKIEDED